MIPIHVALVPHYEDEYVNPPTVLRVAAALQMQLTRDFTPIWGAPAVISPFLSLDQVPPGCIPLVIVKPGSLSPSARGFHITEQGHPIGLVEGGEGWSLPASHELLETVCDPQGTRRVMGESIADSEPKALVDSARGYLSPQGQVAYLLEVCDPCQRIHYTINGFQVADFVTPRYYAPGDTEAGSYSFTGKVKKPREVLPGGYITWYTSISEAPVWQAIRNADGDLTIGPLAISTLGLAEFDVDYSNELLSGLGASKLQSVPSARTEELAGSAAKRYGAELEREVDRLLADYRAERKEVVALKKLLPILERLATDEHYHSSFAKNPDSFNKEVKRLGLPRIVYPGEEFPSRKQFETVYQRAKWLYGSQAGLKVSGLVAGTMMLGTTTVGGSTGGGSGGTPVNPKGGHH